jgi:hypothetical protein
MKPLRVEVVLIAALALLCACAPPAQPKAAQIAGISPKAATMFEPPTGGWWALLIPPQRAYAADRSYTMGGPLATAPMEGQESHGAYITYSVNQLDTGAPLSQWKKVALFFSEQECEQAKAKLIDQANDPAWVAAQALKTRTRVLDPSRYLDMLQTMRCQKG